MKTNNPTINNFLAALESIEEINYQTSKVSFQNDRIAINKKRSTTYENNFVTQLNVQYAILNYAKEITEPRELTRQLQIPKRYLYSNERDEEIFVAAGKIRNISSNDSDYLRELTLIPDFFIHKDQDDMSPENQRLIAEVKTERELPYERFLWDFFKLTIYLNKYNFQNAVFLCIHTRKDTILKYIDQYIKERLYLPKSYSKLYIIIKENFLAKPEIFTLQELFDKFNNNK
ncbi:hypothetical protein J2795_003213 [Chryseobacterium bernardetii]|uniref:Uncharacterized protein n=1 Tax=Chryseobacterium bernardetii TaxID=1241978 RepID=A0ACC6IXR8_9FLAO|nr:MULTISPECIES: hypothetical protein [Chryseobacterium]MDR6372129.1 hypothetical protein [Chryseobacterium vietnamense]MDR6442488.1 hypothetical protein [Chryseobacterium bernardetii]